MLKQFRIHGRLLLIVLSIAASHSATAGEKYDYVLRDLDGVEHRASDSQGKWLVINFWATWCAPCIKEMPELQSFYENQRDNADLWGVTFEDTNIDAIRDFIARLEVTYPILGYGQDPRTGYGQVRVLPTTFVIDPNGKFFHKFEGPITSQDLIDTIRKDFSQIGE